MHKANIMAVWGMFHSQTAEFASHRRRRRGLGSSLMETAAHFKAMMKQFAFAVARLRHCGGV